VKHLVPDTQHGQEYVKITLVEHEKVLESVKKAIPKQQAEIESLKLGLLYLHNCLESMNIAHVEQQQEPDLVKKAKEVKTLDLEKKLDDIDGFPKFIAWAASSGSYEM
jgi:hypothetical protein